MEILIAMVIGFLLDLVLGDPAYLYHPVQAIGALISALEKLIRKGTKTAKGEILGGAVLVAATCFMTFACAWLVIKLLGLAGPVFKILGQTIMFWQCLSVKSLSDAAVSVYKPLKNGNLEKSRKALSLIVGRDTENLSEQAIARAAIETVAENTCDGIIAPMLFFALGGGPLAFLYKAVNTMDSMIAYKNDKYINLGKTAAMCDDIANYIPARIGAAVMLLAARLCGYNAREAFRAYIKDRNSHESPNSAHTESVCAGALGVWLGGSSYYKGVISRKPKIYEQGREATGWDIMSACRLSFVTAVIFLIAANAVRLLYLKVSGG